ncbi:TonB-dependent receptor plug domain-containing protein [Agaribacterium haliotis]|uniref:TonB-dependent receptor plug domain-containing protein n=1 Tax=Agaribacterium haliotis TaxID=2013869 RepID=UPI000BB5528D|nr:TonB-dependent receptor plug domain-containing protein [Agaribacterium haliotis]
MRRNFKLHALSAAVMGAFVSAPIYAQEEAATENDENLLAEELIVTGFRQSVERAVDSKRLADTVSDSIFAEDVGKSTDQNIADALSRITGVSVTEESGEGARITVRGASPSQNVISMNGVELTGGLAGPGDDATSNNSVDLSSFSADILSSINVIKTAAADQNEGSLGANIELNTLQPLALAERRRILTAEGRHNEFRGSNDYRISGSYGDKFFDDSFGVVFTLTADKNSTREDRIENNWEEGSYRIADPLEAQSASVFTARDLEGRVIRVADYDGTAPDGYNPETETLVQAPFSVAAMQSTNLSTSITDRERVTGNLGLQFQPTDSTDIQLDLTHTKQTVDNDYLSFFLGYSGDTPQSDDINSSDGTNWITEWTSVDVENQTMARRFGRAAQGNTNTFESERELTTNVASLRLDQQLTDSLAMKFRAGYSQTTDELLDGRGVNTATWGTIRPGDLPSDSSQIEPIGFDCSTGKCSYQTGESYASYDPVFGLVTDVNTIFNPYDTRSSHIGNVTWRTNTQTDTNTSLNLDFDWDFDAFSITTIEFGAKYGTREKEVQTQNETLTTGTVLISRDDPNTSYSTNGMQNIRLDQFQTDEAFPFDDFAEGLDVDRSQPWFGGWPTADIDKALTLLSGQDPNSIGRAAVDAGSREIATDTAAAYVKANFEFLDGRLTANVGLRYVRDETEADGYGSARFTRPNWLYDAIDLFQDRQLANTDLAPCPVPADGRGWEYVDDNGNSVEPTDTNEDGTAYFLFDPANKADFNNCFDWRLTHAYVAGNTGTFPVNPDGSWRFVNPNTGENIYDVNRLLHVDYSSGTPVVVQNDGLTPTIYDPTQWNYDAWVNNPGSLPTTNTNSEAFRHFNTSGLIYGYVDHTTSFTGPLGNDPVAQTREAPVSDRATQNILLPSMTLNFQINDDMILRGAVSRTMTRAPADWLNPRLQIIENVWDPQDAGEKGNTELKPLTSDNFDLSYEWYFGDANMLSAGFFYKGLKNMPLQVQSYYHYENIRGDYYPADLNVLMDYDTSRSPLTSDCAAQRSVGNFSADNDGWSFNCRDLVVTETVNGSEGKIEGLELGYTQIYDFLPGMLANTGVQANYTYQYSTNDPVETSDGRVEDPLPNPWTPQHSANLTLFWENEKVELRLANRYTGVQMTERTVGGAIWKDATNRMDFSASYHINDFLSVSFNALNVLDETHRTFYTLNQSRMGVEEDGVTPHFVSEDWGFYGDTHDERTVSNWKTGRQFRVGIRANF